MSSATGISIRRSIAVDAAQAKAFEMFVDMTAWWPLDTHTLGAAPGRASIVEPRSGGRWYGIDKNGDAYGIGHVLVYEAPQRLVLTWEVSHAWKYDPTLRTEIEVRFIPETAGRTRIELEHRGLEAYAERADEQREMYEGCRGWTYILERYAKGIYAHAI